MPRISPVSLPDDSPAEADAAFPARDRRTALLRRLRQWFRRQQRDLPWRREPTPYRVWVSEIMLQQTQVATVRDYFERFMATFPDLPALAEATEEQVLRHWEGLGYYRRARQLHAAAREVVSRFQGELPGDYDSLVALPGIGRYTAGAILSIAFDKPFPILEANTKRLLSRLIGWRHSVESQAGQRLLWDTAERLAQSPSPGEINQALMELGSLLCTPRAPQCEACPLQSDCFARKWNLQHSIPAPPAKKAFIETTEAAVVVLQGAKVLLRQCQAGERWAGLWDFLRFSLSPSIANAASLETGSPGKMPGSEAFIAAQAVQQLAASSGWRLASPRHWGSWKHGVTKFRITLHCVAADFVNGPIPADGTLRWVDAASLGDFPLSSSGRRIARLVARHESPGEEAATPAIAKRRRPKRALRSP